MCASAIDVEAKRFEAKMWWTPPTADTFRKIEMFVNLATNPASGAHRFNVVFEFSRVSKSTPEPTLDHLEWQLDDGPSFSQNVGLTPTWSNRKFIVPVDVDTSLLQDGWHRLRLSGIVRDGGSQTRMIELELSFETNNGNPSGDGAPRGARASGMLVDQPESVIGAVDIEILSTVPALLPSLWHADMRSQGTLSVQGNQFSGPTLFVAFDHRPGPRSGAYVQVNDWPVSSPDFTLPLEPPDGELWMTARSMLDTQSHSLGVTLLLSVEADPNASDESPDPPDDTPPDDAPPDETDGDDPPQEPPTLLPGQWYVTAGGTGNGSPDAPFGRVQQGLDAGQAGDIIIVLPGIYQENLATVRNGTASQRITLAARDGLGSVEIVDANNDAVLDVLHSNVVVTGFTFNGNLSAEQTVRVRDGGDFLFFAVNEVERSKIACIDMAGPEGVAIERTLIHDCQATL